MKKISLVFLSLVIGSLALPNAAMLTALASNNNNDNSSFKNNAAAYSNTANTNACLQFAVLQLTVLIMQL